MLKKIIVGFIILGTVMSFGMSLSKINKASKSDLMAINGIGEVKAKAIMKARPFSSLKDVESVKGVGPQLLANLKGDVKSTDAVKKVRKSTKSKAKKTKTKSKKSTKEKADKKTKTKKRKIKSMDDKKKELKTKAKKTKKKKTKAKKTKTKKTKAKKTKKTKSKKKN